VRSLTGTALKLVLVGAVAFLQGAFVWVITYNPVLDAFYGENGLNGVAIWLRDATISMTWLPSMSRLIDYLCMAALVVVFCCVYLLSEGPRLLDALAVSMSLMVELGFIVLFFDRGGLFVHFTDSSPYWFTNAFVLAAFTPALAACVLLRHKLK
jgi:hypothetical protein